MLKNLLAFIKSLVPTSNSFSKPSSSSRHILLVCTDCHHKEKKEPYDGTILLDKLNAYCSDKIQSDEFEIKPIDCLWACSKGCVVSVSSHNKPTYVFANLHPEESAAPLLEFMQLYVKNRKGPVVWKKVPKLIQSSIHAQIPPIVADKN